MPVNILLLQGPLGPFFRRFATDLRNGGHKVYKVNLNGGDVLFFNGKGVFNYQGSSQAWAAWIEKKLLDLAIDRIYLFGDCRTYHKVAREVATRQGISVYVFEEGYLRPNYITLEAYGVNGHSRMSQDPADFRRLIATAPRRKYKPPVTFPYAAMYSVAYYLACRLLRRYFPFYHHHRPITIWGEGSKWLLSWGRKSRYFLTGLRAKRKLLAAHSGDYFLAVLQVHCDMQVKEHSGYRTIEQFIEETIVSFTSQAPAFASLVFKHHPMDRGYRNYARLISELGERHGLGSRLVYIHDLHLPSLLKKAVGTVTINSTVGLSSLYHGTPVKVLGRAVYDMVGLTFQGELGDFWSNPGEVDRDLFIRFRAYLLRNNQINGNLYFPQKQVKNAAGLIWPNNLKAHTTDPTPDSRHGSDTTLSLPLEEIGKQDIALTAPAILELSSKPL